MEWLNDQSEGKTCREIGYFSARVHCAARDQGRPPGVHSKRPVPQNHGVSALPQCFR